MWAYWFRLPVEVRACMQRIMVGLFKSVHDAINNTNNVVSLASRQSDAIQACFTAGMSVDIIREALRLAA